jgi:hypothetical protein
MTITAFVDFLDFLVWMSLVPDRRPRFLIVLDPTGRPAPVRRPPAACPGLFGVPDGRPRPRLIGTDDTWDVVVSLSLFLDPSGRPRFPLTGVVSGTVTGAVVSLSLFLDPMGRPRLTGVKPEYNISLQSHMTVDRE